MKKILFASLMVAAFAGSANAQKTVPFAPGAQASATKDSIAASPTSCSFLDKKLPDDTIVVAAGSYSGRKLAFQIDQSGHEATQFDVAVHSDKPVALLLSAYEPTVWSIGWTKNTKIVAVYATGYHRQAVAGLPKGTPVITSSFTEKDPCGYNILSEGGLTWVNPKSRAVFGKEAIRVYNKANNGLLDIVESSRAKTEYVTSPDTPPEKFKDPNAPLAGKAGLDAAVAKGILRPLNQNDIEMVRAHYREQADKLPPAMRPDVPPVAGGNATQVPAVRIPSLHPHNGYVVQKAFVYPAGLYGGNSASFIVLKGVPTPTGNPGHSTVVDLNKSAPCTGVMCR